VAGPYIPPQPRRPQVVRPAGDASRHGQPRRWWWLLPVAGLVPLIVAVLATQGAFRGPVASRPPATASAVGTSSAVVAAAPTAAGVAATPTAPSGVTSVATGTAASASTASSTSAPGAIDVAGETASSTSGTPASSTASTTDVTGGGQPFVAYRVQSGDTVRFIARTYGVSAASIAQASGLQNPDLVRVGQVLTIPAQPGWLYRIQPGETLDQVAARAGISSDQIASASGLSIASVGPGTLILIPDQSAARQGK